MTPPFGLMMFWLPQMRMRPLWMSAMRRPRMPQTMLAVSVRVTVTLTTLNSVMINVLAGFRTAGLSCAVIPGGLTSFIQVVDVFLAFLYRTCHHQLYLQMAENKRKWTAADARNAFVDLSHRGLKMAKSKIDMSPNQEIGVHKPP